MAEDQIARARDHAAKGRAIVAQQRDLIAQIRAQGRDSVQAEDLLVRFEASLRIFEEDLSRLEGSGDGFPARKTIIRAGNARGDRIAQGLVPFGDLSAF